MLLTDAITFAAQCHQGQCRKGTDIPYIVHPMEACAIAAAITSDEQVLAAAVLHDVAEDCGISSQELEARFGRRVAALVAWQSERKEADAQGSWMRRKQHTIDGLDSAGPEELILTLADKLSNLRAIHRDVGRLGEGLWERFNQRDKKMHGWYYRAIFAKLKRLGPCPALAEYDALAEAVFGPAQA